MQDERDKKMENLFSRQGKATSSQFMILHMLDDRHALSDETTKFNPDLILNPALRQKQPPKSNEQQLGKLLNLFVEPAAGQEPAPGSVAQIQQLEQAMSAGGTRRPRSSKPFTESRAHSDFNKSLPADQGLGLFKVKQRDPYTYVKKPEAPSATFYKPRMTLLQPRTKETEIRHPSTRHVPKQAKEHVPRCMPGGTQCDRNSR